MQRGVWPLSILTLNNLSKKYKKHSVLQNINLSIDSPGIYALVGPNGVGKTTLLNIITNILPASSGSVEILGETNKNYKVFKEIAYLQDNSILFDYLSGFDHLKYVCDIHNIHKKRIVEVAAYVGMETYLKKIVGSYSLGMKQHLLLAMALINNPKLLLMDEPLNGLDPTSAILMRKILLELVKKNTTIILSSHNLGEIDRVTKQVLFLKDGNLIEVDMNKHETISYLIELFNPEEGYGILIEQGFKVEETGNGIIKIDTSSDKLDYIISELKRRSIVIKDIQKEISGSEKLYEEFFN